MRYPRVGMFGRSGWTAAAAGSSAVALLLLGSCGASFVHSQELNRESKQKRGRMSGIAVTANPEKAAVLPGESLVVRSTVQNQGSAPVNVPDEQGASPMAYALAPEGAPEGRTTYEMSQAEFSNRVKVGLTPAKPIRIDESLPTGGTQLRKEDIALLSEEPFAPGKYRLTATWTLGEDQVTSGFTRVAIAQPNIEILSSEACRRSEEIRTVFLHRRQDGDAVLYERASRGNRPQYGVFRPRFRLPKAVRVGDVAPAVLLHDSGFGNWMAWLADGKLNVAGLLADSVNATPPPQPVDLPHAKLAGPGFHMGPGKVIFFVANPTTLELWSANREAIKREWSAPLGQNAVNTRILARQSGADATFVAVFEEGPSLMRKDFTMKGDSGQPALELAKFEFRLLTWSLDTTDYPSPSVLTAVTASKDPLVFLARVVDLDAKQAPGAAAPKALPAVTPESKPDLWAVRWFHGGVHVAMRDKDTIRYAAPVSHAWKEVGATTSETKGWITLYSPHPIKLWAEWSIANRGPVRTQLVQTRQEEE